MAKTTKEMITEIRNRVWTTREGEELKVKDMDINHIENCIKLLKKKGYISVKNYIRNPTLDKKKVARFIDIFDLELELRERFQTDLINTLEDSDIELWKRELELKRRQQIQDNLFNDLDMDDNIEFWRRDRQ